MTRPIPLAYLAPEVLGQLACGRETSAVNLYDLCFPARELREEQLKETEAQNFRNT